MFEENKIYKVFIYMIMKINLHDIVVYSQKKRRTRRDIDEVAKNIDEQTSTDESTNG